jgi:hypothetical protein
MRGPTLALSSDLALPLAVAGQVIALVGIRNAGKTNTAGVIAEELLDRHHQVVFLDPTDASWGLRSGYPIFIFGGPHGDVPLNEADGKTIAEFVVMERVPLILSLRHLRKAAQRRFVTEFAEELYHLKGKDQYRDPLTVVIDEAPLFVPQRVTGEVARVTGAIEDLCARGRNAGFGVVLVSQRAATINKDVLTQADTIIAHRLIGPQDRKAVREWMEENASAENLKDILASLATLKAGEAWVWAPLLSIMRRIQIRKRRTFDSSASPTVGGHARAPRHLHEVDLGKLKAKLAANIEQARAADPKALQRQVATLTAEVAKLQAQTPPQPTKPVTLKVPAPILQAARALSERLKGAQHLADQFAALDAKAEGWLADLMKEITRAQIVAETLVPPKPLVPPGEMPMVPRIVSLRPGPPPSGDRVPGRSPLDQKILDAVAWWESARIATPTRQQVAFAAGRTIGGHFNNTVSRLHTSGLLTYPAANLLALTAEGRHTAWAPGGVATRADLYAKLRGLLGSDLKRQMLEALIQCGGAATREELAQAVGRTIGGHFNNCVSRLSSLGIIHYPASGLVEFSPLVTALKE